MAGPKIEFPKRKAPKKKTTQKGGTKKGATKKDTKGDPKKPDEQTLPEESNTILADVSNKDELVKILDSMDTNQARNAILGLDNEPFYVIQDPKTNNLHFKESYSLIVELLKEKKNIRTDKIQDDHDDEDYGYIITLLDTKTNVSLPGSAYQSKYEVDQNGKIKRIKGIPVRDPYAKQTAMSKALRNAGKKFISKDIIFERFKDWYKEKYKKDASDDVQLVQFNNEEYLIEG